MLRTLGLLFTTTIAILLIWQSDTHAQATFNLQSDINQLRSQVQRLQAEVNGVAEFRDESLNLPSPSPSPNGRGDKNSSSLLLGEKGWE
ncbi:MAG: hypothetical protein LH647_20840 [Leptolyngbyaceae cyanobacterium CAN_BIN12]|nr:hypothetical protein [Leptolyngbyaceae cyanobacterium CAN_BIN12]